MPQLPRTGLMSCRAGWFGFRWTTAAASGSTAASTFFHWDTATGYDLSVRWTGSSLGMTYSTTAGLGTSWSAGQMLSALFYWNSDHQASAHGGFVSTFNHSTLSLNDGQALIFKSLNPNLESVIPYIGSNSSAAETVPGTLHWAAGGKGFVDSLGKRRANPELHELLTGTATTLKLDNFPGVLDATWVWNLPNSGGVLEYLSTHQTQENTSSAVDLLRESKMPSYDDVRIADIRSR